MITFFTKHSKSFLITVLLFGLLGDPLFGQSDNGEAVVTIADLLQEEFLQECEQRKSKPDGDKQWRRDWLERFAESARSTDDAALKMHLAKLALGLANELNDFDTSREMLELLIASSAGVVQKSEWQSELGGLLRRMSKANLATSESGIDVLQGLADELTKASESELLPPATMRRLVLTWFDLGRAIRNSKTENRGKRSFDSFSEAETYLRNFGILAEKEQNGTPQSHRGPSTYLDAYNELLAFGITRDKIVAEQIYSIALIPDDDLAYSALDRYRRIPNTNKPLYEMVLIYPQKAYPTNIANYQEFLLRWLDRNPLDYAALKVRVHLATSFVISKDFQKALSTIKPSISQNSILIFQAEEPEAFLNRAGGTLADSLAIAAKSYLNIGDIDEAKAIATIFVELFNNDERASDMKLLLQKKTKVNNSLGTNEPLKSSGSRTLFIANLLIISCVVIYFFGKKIYSKL